VIVASVRSGLAEAVHPVTAAVVDAAGRVVFTMGEDLDRPFFMRSASKPFQGFVSQESGAGLGTEQLALACASHGGQPVHVAHAREMLAGVGLDETALLCPPDHPTSDSAADLWAAKGMPVARILHNCSGKHSAMLRACVASDWPLTYTDPDHPLQRRNIEFASEVTGMSVEPVGVDGCGVPTLRTDVVAMARSFARLATEGRFAEVRDAMMRFPSLTCDGMRQESQVARWLPGAVKGGAEGCVGVAWAEGGLGFAAKAWTGSHAAAMVAVLEAMIRVGVVPSHVGDALDSVVHPPVLGGGVPQGRMELVAG
jgi:L-asparaginase II